MYNRSLTAFEGLKTQSVHDRLIGLFKVTDGLGDILDLLYSQNLAHLFLQYFAFTIGAKPEQANLEAYQNSMMMGLCFGSLDEWIKRGRKESPEEMVALLQGVAKRCLED